MPAGIKANSDGSGAIQVGGTDVISMDTSGNVGIGTSAPSGNFQVSGANPRTRLTNTSGTTTTVLQGSDSGAAFIGTETNAPYYFVTNNTERFRVGQAGQLGIGGANYGSAGQVLTSSGPSAAPTWGSAASGFAAGTAMLFVQTAAPTGWTKSTTHDNKALRVVSGTASSGGSVAFTTAFASQAVAGTVGNFTLTTNEIPSHLHGIPATTVGALVGGGETIPRSVSNPGTLNTRNTGGGAAHNHTFSGTAINLAVQYVDVIIATKD